MVMTLLSMPKIGSVPPMMSIPKKAPMNGMSSARVMPNKMPMTKSMTPEQCAKMLG